MRFRSHLAMLFVTFMAAACDGSPRVADVGHGATLYAQCRGCHAMNQNKAGPLHCGLIGRAAAVVPNYQYSDAMRRSGIVWSEQTLDDFLKAPLSNVSGTKMGFAGLYEKRDRQDLIAFLAQATHDAAACAANERPS